MAVFLCAAWCAFLGAVPVRAENGYLVRSREENRRLLMELVSGSGLEERTEVFVTGEDYVPDSLVIAQMFPDVQNISNTVMEEYERDGHRYVRCRIGFERKAEETSCSQDRLRALRCGIYGGASGKRPCRYGRGFPLRRLPWTVRGTEGWR